MANALLQGSMAGGELSPALFARVNLAKYASGAALLRNFYVDYRGGASTRPGTEYIGTCVSTSPTFPTPPRLIPFIVSTEAAYVLEMGQEYMKFISDGAYVESSPGVQLIISTPYAAEDLQALKYTQSADVLTLTHAAYPIYNLTRTSATAFSLDADVIGPTIEPPATVTITQTNTTTSPVSYAYVLTSFDAKGQESISSLPAILTGSQLGQTGANPVVNNIDFTAIDSAVSYGIYKVGPIPAGLSSLPTLYGFIGQTFASTFVDNNIAPDFGHTPPTFQDPFSPGQVASVAFTDPGTGYIDYVNPLTPTGDGTDFAGYALANPATGEVTGVVITNPGKNYTTLTVTDGSPGTPATYVVTLGQLTGTYPTCPGYFQQRRLFGGTTNFPEAFVASQTGAYDNFNTSPISQDTDAITASLASQQVNAIKSFVSVATGLIVFTTGGGFLVSGGSPSAAITPSNITALPQPSSGCNDLPPIPVNIDVLYCQNRGSVVRDLSFNFYVQSYSGTDRSVLASHLFANQTLREWCYSEEPFRLVQLVRDDGVMLVMTYVPEQEIYAWSHYDTNGMFISVASIPEGTTNTTYVIAERFVGGSWTYYVERFASGLFDTLQDAWCLDCALSTPENRPDANISLTGISGNIIALSATAIFSVGDIGKVLWANTGQAVVTAVPSNMAAHLTTVTPFEPIPDNPALQAKPIPAGDWILNPVVSTVSGLAHLEGVTVAVVSDGVPVTSEVVAGGSVAVSTPGSRVLVGLPYQCQLQTLRLEAGEPTLQGKRKIIPAVTVIVNRTLGLKSGRTFAEVLPISELKVPTAPTVPALLSIEARTLISSEWEKYGQVCFQQDLPLPATILGIVPEATIGDTMR